MLLLPGRPVSYLEIVEGCTPAGYKVDQESFFINLTKSRTFYMVITIPQNKGLVDEKTQNQFPNHFG